MFRLRNSDLSPEAQDAECLSYSARKRGERCVYCGPQRPVHTAAAADALHLAAAISGPLVSIEEAERRAYICRMCPYLVPVEGCSGCVNLIGRLTQLVSGRSTKHDEVLGACGLCGCSAMAKVHFEQTTVPNPPEWCWASPTSGEQ
jgi:hypothetical protein